MFETLHRVLRNVAAAFALSAICAACAPGAMWAEPFPAPQAAPPAAMTANMDASPAPRAGVLRASVTSNPVTGRNAYELGSGDKVRITVFGETDLSGEYDVDGSGNVRLPLVGQVRAAGLSLHDFEAQIADTLRHGYLRDPKVSVEVTAYRPFYIIGEVTKPGQYPYVNGMTALNAVALAGGYTYRADDSDVYVRRNGHSREVELPADQTTRIYPGDVVRVSERYF